MEISKTQIEKRMKKKTNPQLVKTIFALKKVQPEFAKIMSTSTRRTLKLNVEELDKACKDGDKVIVPGKILGGGLIVKKLKVVAFSASAEAEEKIKKAKGEFISILEEMKKNPKLNDLKLLKK